MVNINGFFGFTGFNSTYYLPHDTIAINLGIVQGTMPVHYNNWFC